MKSAARRLARPAALALALTLAVSLLGCSSGDDDGYVESTFDIRLTTGSGMRGVSMVLLHTEYFELIALEEGEPPLASGSCSQNVTAGQIRATCATTTSFAAPIDAWRVTMRHQSSRDIDDAILDLDCEASDATGNTFSVGCQVVQ